MSFKGKYKNIEGISVHQEGPKRCKFVGKLNHDPHKNQYVFTYSLTYLEDTKAIPLGPDLPLTQRIHVCSSVFPAFLDRIPEKQNPAYASYCEQFGIDAEEDNPFVLLSTIGRRGPSSFVFEPIWGQNFGPHELKAWREGLGLSSRDFADAFGLSQANLVRIENEKASGASVLPMLEIFHDFPQAGAAYVEKHAKNLHQEKKRQLMDKFRADVFISQELSSSIEAKTILEKSPLGWTKDFLNTDKIKDTFTFATQNKDAAPNLEKTKSLRSMFFEVRFARDICLSKLEAQYEKKFPKSEKDIDFYISLQQHHQAWNIELTSLGVSDETVKNTRIGEETEGLSYFKYSPSYSSGKNASEAVDYIKVQRVILDKSEKFSLIENSTYNLILIDMRGFCKGTSDEGDYLNIVYGPQIFYNSDELGHLTRSFVNEKNEEGPFLGIFDERHPLNNSNLCKYVHGLGFIRERTCESREIIKDVKIYGNPHIFQGNNISDHSDILKKEWKETFRLYS